MLASDLVSAGLGNVEILVEQQLPLTSKRVDAVLAGNNPRTGEPSYVLVELKQWSSAQSYEDDMSLVMIDAYGPRPLLHPLDQVSGYRDYLLDFLPGLDGQEDNVVAVAYLHNATEASVFGLRERPESRDVRLFTGEGKGRFLDFLRTRLDPDVSGVDSADRLLGMKAGPSRQLLTVAAAEIRDREQFVLLDEQKVAFGLVCTKWTGPGRRTRRRSSS